MSWRREAAALALAGVGALLLASHAVAAPPAPSLLSAPPDPSTSRTATFAFAEPAAASFRCRLDDSALEPCTSPVTYQDLADGPHLFRVRGVDANGDVGQATLYRWTIAGPAVSITSGPSSPTRATTATFAFQTAAAAAECRLDGQAFAACTSPVSYTSLPDGEHTFRVRPVAPAGAPATAAAWSWTVDTVAPGLTLAGGPTGAVQALSAQFTFTTSEPASVTCHLDGAAWGPCASPLSYGGLKEGVHVLELRAADAAGNAGTAARTWRIDVTPPALRLPAAPTEEASGPIGARITYDAAGTDRGAPLPPAAVSCAPRSGTTFPLGATTISCTATDDAGNAASGSFVATVRDTTPPTINAPDVQLEATGAYGIRRTDKALVAYRNAISAVDLVSPATISVDIPATLPVGRSALLVNARDRAGNEASKRVAVTVLAVGSVASTSDLMPPLPVRRARIEAGDHLLRLTWLGLQEQAAHVVVRLLQPRRTWPGRAVYRGRESSVVVRGLKNGIEHRLSIVVVDRAGNRSRAVVLVATPTAVLLAEPAPNAIVSEAPLFRWAPVGGASYFNLQLFRGRTKVLSAWPRLARLKLPGRWRYDDRVRQLEPGVYTWYVWPGYGERADTHYGPLLGKSRFRVVPATG
ncbi:MAG TPA: HYR domain-containing protein [Gaiellaceae bacterium]|nr:HYR domain-containing protein [Gaiellaceae bacterium]